MVVHYIMLDLSSLCMLNTTCSYRHPIRKHTRTLPDTASKSGIGPKIKDTQLEHEMKMQHVVAFQQEVESC